MRMTLPLPVLLVLGGCQALPAPVEKPPHPSASTEYRALGTEPFWDLTIGHDMVFTDRGTGVSVVEQAPPRMGGRAHFTYRGGQIGVDITPGPCSDGMSDRVYPDTVRLIVDGKAYKGCGAPAALFTRPTP